MRLLAKRQVDPETNCWIWTGRWNPDEKGVIYLPVRRSVYVHVAAAHVWLNQPLKGDHKVVHKKCCPNPACFNPEHLLVFQTAKEICDAQKAGLVQGQKVGIARKGTKMTIEKALQIKNALIAAYAAEKRGSQPEMFVDMAERLNVTIHQVRAIHARRAWRYIWDTPKPRSEVWLNQRRRGTKLSPTMATTLTSAAMRI
jgi:hypothetical protein